MAAADPAVDAWHAASERVAARLRDDILGGRILPGERLRQEEIAERLAASRIPVREALRMLEAEGLTEYVPHKGARVLLLQPREVDVIYQMRECLEPLALRESLPRLSAEAVSELERVQDRIEDWQGVEEFLRLDRAFHLTTYSGCEMDLLVRAVTRLWNSTQHYRRLFMNLVDPGSRWMVNAEHRLLLEAIRRRDPDDAELRLRSHIRRTRIELGRHPECFAAAPRQRPSPQASTREPFR